MTKPETSLDKKGQFNLPQPNYLSWIDSYNRTLESVRNHIPVILYGPPGTGKTKIVGDINEQLSVCNEIGKYEVVQFHKKFSYEDFIEGYAPTEDGGFAEKDGVFKAFCANPTHEKTDIFVIDEMNRAELSSTFGEVLYAIEDRHKRVVTTARFGNKFKIPHNLSIIGTMNTADRNISIVDYALRRRFRFIPVYPDCIELQSWLQKIGFSFSNFSIVEYVSFFKKINNRIRKHPLLGPHMQLGQSLFVPVSANKPITPIEITNNFCEVVITQIEAYFGFGSQGEMSSILNPSIVDKYLCQSVISFEDFAAFVLEVIGDKQNG
jgi:5-methylcytosine-specific restriction protein B